MTKKNTDDVIKQASNFELNIMKLGIHTIQLHKGDRFESNGGYFNYVPSTDENKGKGKNYRWSGRQDAISAKKYMKDVLRADNIKLITDRPLSSSEPPDSEYNVRHRFRVWEVQYAYKVELEEPEKLMYLSISKESYDTPTKWKYDVQELSVKRETKELIFLERFIPATYGSRIIKTDLYNVQFDHGTHYVLCYANDRLHECEANLFKAVEKWKEEQIEAAKQLIKQETESLNNIKTLKAEYGF